MSRRYFQKRNLSAVFMLFAFIAFVFVVFMSDINAPQPKAKTVHRNIQKSEEIEDAGFEKNGLWYGLCKKNSVHSISEFRKTVTDDPILKTHFSDFKWENASIGKLDKTILVNVHFRKNDKIFLTKKPIRLPEGDAFITDGVIRVRMQCCNSYSEAPSETDLPDPEFSPGTLPQRMAPAIQQTQPLPLFTIEEPMRETRRKESNPALFSAPASDEFVNAAVNPSAEQTLDPSTALLPVVPIGSDPLMPPKLEPPSGTVMLVPEPSIIILFATGMVFLLSAVKINFRTRKKGTSSEGKASSILSCKNLLDGVRDEFVLCDERIQ